ncbi:protease [Cohnella thailandensis]|uniref:Protease n=1 Tax=Cohnella thailandensis TaxID=557557 RepID=A0A841T217_9BACL|nr:protease [Cohnella thailandensis]MBB6636428.1 protease [Cohnella thailandensis]MBP1973601.1 membrane protein implicated in regulation of membrane protease activity [Cohnella thailandensis]
MDALFWCCLLFGALMALVTLIFGDGLGDAAGGLFSIDLHDVFQPVVLSGGITVFGGMGLLLHRYSELPGYGIYLLSVMGAALIGMGMYFVYVRPMRNSENSTGYSMNELTGMLAEVLTPVPATGFGEVLVKAGVGYSNHVAASFDKVDVPAGTKVVVVEVKEGTLYVSRMD